MLDFLCFCTNSMIRCEENNKDGVAVYLYFPFRYSACCVTTGICILSVSPHSVIHSPSPFCPWSTFVSHYVLFLYSCAMALYDCLQSFSLTYSSDLFHLCQLPSFNSCLLLQLGEHITSLTGSLKRMCASFILCSSTMSFLLSPPPHRHSGFLYSPSFPSILFCLTYFISDIFFSRILSQMWFSLFPPFSYFTAGPLLLLITSLNIPPTAHLFHTFPPEKGTKRELPAFFSSFFTPYALFLSFVWQFYHLLLRLIIPAGSLQWNFLTPLILWCSEVSFLRESDRRRSWWVCACCVRDKERETVTVGCRLSGCFLESKNHNKEWKRRTKERTNEMMKVLSMSSISL